MTDFPFKFQDNGRKFPILISIPHGGTEIPSEFKTLYNENRISPPADTDWHVGLLYKFAENLGISTIESRYSRYLIDLNRPTDGESLYNDGRVETSLVPTKNFAGEALYRNLESEPSELEIKQRIKNYYRPYHNKIAEELALLKDTFGYAILYEAHSIRRFVPLLSPKPFPDLILGNQKGATCSHHLFEAVSKELDSGPYTLSQNHPFMGGYLTRTWGRPNEGIHSLQLEISQDLYMNENNFEWDQSKATKLSLLLEQGLKAMIEQGQDL